MAFRAGCFRKCPLLILCAAGASLSIHARPANLSLETSTQLSMISHRPLKIPLTALRLALGLTTISATGQIHFTGSGNAFFSSPENPAVRTDYPEPPSSDGSNPGRTKGSVSLTGDGINTLGTVSASYAAASGWSGLSASALSQASVLDGPVGANNPPVLLGAGDGSALLFVTDLVFSGFDSEVSDIPISLNVLFSSAQHATAVGTGSTSGSSHFTIRLGSGLNPVSGLNDGSISFSADSGATALGLLDGYSGGLVTVISGVFEVETGVPVRMEIGLGALAYASPDGSLGYSGNANAAAYLSLPTGKPLFNLPEGFTVNSASLHVVDNRYLPPSVAGDTKVSPTVNGDQLILTWSITPDKTYTVRRASSPAGPYETVAIGLTQGTYTETIGNATGRYYRVIAE